MALKVWLPLNGSLENKGISDLKFSTINNTNTTISSEGKIGSCYSNNSFNAGGITSDKKITLPITHSMFCWFKFTNLNNISALGGGLVTVHNHLTNSGTGITIKYVSSTTGYLSLNTGNGSSRTYNAYTGTTLLQANTWYHGGFTYDGTNICLYLNGNLEKTQVYSNMAMTNELIKIFIWSTTNNGYNFNGSLNDVRIYDHCLSQKEIKEISQGLVLHYKLDNSAAESTTNLLPQTTQYSVNNSPAWDTSLNGTPMITPTGWGSGYNSGVPEATTGYHMHWIFDDNGKLIMYSPNKNSVINKTGRWMGISCWIGVLSELGFSAGCKYTLSWEQKTSNLGLGAHCGLYYKLTSSSSNNFNDGHPRQYNTQLNTWQKMEVNFTMSSSFDENTATTGSVYFYGESATYEGDLYLRNMQLELKDHATPYTEGKTTRNSCGIIDSSGYGNNGIQNNITIEPDSMRYLSSAKFNGSNSYIKVKDNNWLSDGMEALTINLWGKASNWNSAKIFSCTETGGFNTETGNSGYLRFPVYVFTNAEKTSKAYKYDSKEIQVSVLSTTDWNMITWVYDSTGTKTYINGKMHHTYTNTSYGISFNARARLFLGCEANSADPSSPYFNGQISDFRIYTTALSAEDILTLYNTPAQIDNLSNVHSFEFEESANIKLGQNGVFQNQWSEGLELKSLSDGSVWAKLFYFDYDEANEIWTPKEAKWCKKTGKYSCLGDLEKFIPASGWYEFWYTEDTTGSKFIRWKQSYNPLSRVTSRTSGTASEYQFISGTNSSSFTGFTRYTTADDNSCYLRGYPSWWGAIAPYQTSYDVFPSLWGGSTNNHHQELWINISENENISRLMANTQSLYLIEK